MYLTNTFRTLADIETILARQYERLASFKTDSHAVESGVNSALNDLNTAIVKLGDVLQLQIESDVDAFKKFVAFIEPEPHGEE